MLEKKIDKKLQKRPAFQSKRQLLHYMRKEVNLPFIYLKRTFKDLYKKVIGIKNQRKSDLFT
jgi:hypothetical protein